MPVVAQRQNSIILAATATSIQLNRALYSVVVPAFGLVLLVLALKKGFTSGNHSRSAYVSIASLAVLSGLAGSLGSHAQAESIIQALLSLFLCIPVLHLTSLHNTSTLSLSRCQFIIRTLLKSLLFISLSSAALLAVLNTSPTHKLPAAVYISFPATFFAYTIFALCLLLSQISLEFCQANPAILSSRSARPITINIHVATRSAAVPINLARSSGFSAIDPREHQSIQESDKFSTEFAEHQKRPSVDSGISIISTFKPTNFVGSAHPSRSNSRQGTNTPEFNPLTDLQFHPRIQGLLPLISLLLAQFALCASYSCKLVIDYNFKPPSAHVLEIIRTSLSVVGVMATMKAYLLHACNTHLGSLGLSVPNSRSSTRYSNSTTPNLESDVAGRQFGHSVTPPVPPKSLAPPSSVPGHRFPVQPSLDPRFSPTMRAYHRPRSTVSDHDRSTLHMTEGDEKGCDTEKGRLVNSFSVGSLKSSYGTSGSEESDQTRVEGSVESNMSRVDLKGIHGHASTCQRVESPQVYAKKRGAIPARPENSVPKKLFGFGWLNGIANRYRGEKEFIDMGEERYGMKSYIPSSVSPFPLGTLPMAQARGREPKKLKKNTTVVSPIASATLATPTSHPPSAFTCAYWNSDSTLCRTSNDLETDMSMGNIAPATPVRSSTRKLAKKRSREYVAPIYAIHESPKKRTCEVDEKTKNGNSACGRMSSPGSLRLKRSFKLDDGRTLSPQLTLAAAIAGEGCTPPPMEAGSSSCSRWERVVDSGQELIRLDQIVSLNGRPPEGMPMGEERVGSSQVNGAMTAEIKTESDGKWEGRNAPPPLSETRPHPGPGKSRERPNIKVSPNNAQCPLDVSTNSPFIPATSEPIKESIPTASITYPSTPSEPTSCSSSAASPLVPDRTPMIFRSSASDHGHGQRSLEPLPLARISSSPSSRAQPALSRRYNAGTLTTPTRGQSTFSSSSSSSSLRLSAATIEGVRNAFSGIWSGKRSGKIGVQDSPVLSTPCGGISNRGSPEASAFDKVAIVEDDNDDDFMDLRDPFASPRVGKLRRIPSSGCAGVTRVDSSEDGYGEPCEDIFATGGFKKTKTWRRSPVTPTKGYSSSVPGESDTYPTYLLTGTETTAYFSRLGDVPPHAKSKEHRKERRARKRMQRRPKISMTKLPVLDDVEFDVEEALLSQRLLKRLDDIHGPGVRL